MLLQDISQEEQDRKFIKWWHKHDQDMSGHVTMDEFSTWWVHQSDRQLQAASHLDWSKAERELASDLLLDADGDIADGDMKERERGNRFAKKSQMMDKELSEAAKEETETDVALKALRGSRWTKTYKHLASDRQPFGVATGAARPPMIRTRLMKYKLLKKSELETLKSGDSLKTRDTVDKVGGGLESVGELLGEYQRRRKRCVWIDDVKSWVSNHIGGLHTELFASALLELERRYGHGISELLHILKWMLSLNFMLGAMWFFIVIIPRDFNDVTRDTSFAHSARTILGELLWEDESEEERRSLFYSGYTSEPVSFYGWAEMRMDVLYFVAILLNVLLSLFVILRTLGLKVSSLAQGSDLDLDLDQLSTDRDTMTKANFADILGAYDCTVTKADESKEMRQQLRFQLERWLMKHEESEAAKELHDNFCKWLRHTATLYTGKLLTLALYVAHVTCLFIVLDSQDWIAENVNRLASPLIISGLNALVPSLIKIIVLHEDHVKAESELKATMLRVYLVKMIQLFVILLKMRNDGGDANADECQEERFGALFFKLVLTDAMVFMTTQYLRLYAVNHGLPRVWRYCGPCSVTQNFRRSKAAAETEAEEDEKGGKKSKLQWRLYRPKKRTIAEVLAGEKKQKSKSTWWLLEHVNEGDKGQTIMKWVTSPDMQRLTPEDVGENKLRVYAQMLINAGYATEGDVIRDNLSPDALAKKILGQRGGHRHAPYVRMELVSRSVLERAERDNMRLENTMTTVQQVKQELASKDKAAESDDLMDFLVERSTSESVQSSIDDFTAKGDKYERRGKLKEAADEYCDAIRRYTEQEEIDLFGLGEMRFEVGSFGASYFSADVDERDEELEEAFDRYTSVSPGTRDGDTRARKKDSSGDDEQEKDVEAPAVTLPVFHFQLEVKLLVLMGDRAFRIATGRDRAEVPDGEEEDDDDDSDDSEEHSRPGHLPWALQSYRQAAKLAKDRPDDPMNLMIEKRVQTTMFVFNQHTKRSMKGKKAEGIVLDVATQLVATEGEWSDVTDQVNTQRLKQLPPAEFENFRSAIMMIDCLYRQTFVWVGSTWCPWLPIMAFIMQMLMFMSLKHAMLHGAYKRPIEPWSADKTFKVFMAFALATLLVCVVPTLMWLNQSPLCGPHQRDDLRTCAFDLDQSEVYGTPDRAWNNPPEGPLEEWGSLRPRCAHVGSAVFTTFGVALYDVTADRLCTYENATGARYSDNLANTQYVYCREAEDTIAVGDELSVVVAFLMNPPSLIIMICIMWTRYRYVRVEMEAAKAEVTMLRDRLGHENKFLTAKLRDVTLQSKGGEEALMHSQVLLERTMRHLDKTQKGGLDEICREMAAEIPDDGQHAESISVSELQQFMELVGRVDAGNDGEVDADDLERWADMVEANTIWVGGMDAKFATEKNVREHIADAEGNTILACTVNRISEEREARLIEQYPQVQAWRHKSWALVTFLHKQVAEAKLADFPDGDAGGTHSHAVLNLSKFVSANGQHGHLLQRVLQSHGGFSENPWAAVSWETAREMGLPDLKGSLGRKATSGITEECSPIVEQHTQQLRKTLEVALQATSKVKELEDLESGEAKDGQAMEALDSSDEGSEAEQSDGGLQPVASPLPMRAEEWPEETAKMQQVLVDALGSTFESLDVERQMLCASKCRLRTYRNGFEIVTEGAKGKEFHIITKGECAVMQEVGGGFGGRRLLGKLRTPHYFGEKALLKGQKRSATVVVTSKKAECLTVPKQTFKLFIKPHWGEAA